MIREATMAAPSPTPSPTQLRDLPPAQRRELFRLNRVQALTSLLESRSDLRGVSPVADHLDDAVRWSA
jgi:hypothetical protein